MLGTDGDAASALACQLFDSVMEAEGVGVPAATVYDGPREGAVEATVRRVVGDVDGTAESLAGFVERVGQLAERETRLAASSTMEGNVERAAKTKAGRRVRFARVPTKSVPCPWCAMLASRGFVYTSSENAEAGSHHHCTCTIVPGVQGSTKVSGYDLKHYERVWRSNEIGQRIKLFEQDPTPEAYEEHVGSFIRSLSADAPIDALFGAKPKVKELNTAVALSESSLSVTFLPENAPDGVKNIDALVGGRLFELKCPDPPRTEATESKDPLRFVENNLKKAKKQFLEEHYDDSGESIVCGGPIRVVFDSRGRDFPDNQVRERLARKKQERHIDEVLFVGHSGKVEVID